MSGVQPGRSDQRDSSSLVPTTLPQSSVWKISSSVPAQIAISHNLDKIYSHINSCSNCRYLSQIDGSKTLVPEDVQLNTCDHQKSIADFAIAYPQEKHLIEILLDDTHTQRHIAAYLLTEKFKNNTFLKDFYNAKIDPDRAFMLATKTIPYLGTAAKDYTVNLLTLLSTDRFLATLNDKNHLLRDSLAELVKDQLANQTFLTKETADFRFEKACELIPLFGQVALQFAQNLIPKLSFKLQTQVAWNSEHPLSDKIDAHIAKLSTSRDADQLFQINAELVNLSGEINREAALQVMPYVSDKTLLAVAQNQNNPIRQDVIAFLKKKVINDTFGLSKAELSNTHDENSKTLKVRIERLLARVEISKGLIDIFPGTYLDFKNRRIQEIPVAELRPIIAEVAHPLHKSATQLMDFYKHNR